MSALTPLLGSKPTVLLLSAEHGQAGADPMLARIAVTRALNAGREWRRTMRRQRHRHGVSR
jgi:hypothetical protein